MTALTTPGSNDHVANFEAAKKRQEDFKAKKRADKILRKNSRYQFHNSTSMRTGYSKAYGDNFDAIFRKGKDSEET